MLKISTITRPFLILAITLFFSSCHADDSGIEGKWAKETARTTLTVKVSEEHGHNYLSYCFIFDNGNRINCASNDSVEQFKLTKTSDSGCYTTEIHSYYEPSLATTVSLCVNENELIWRTQGANDLSYIPNNLTFARDSS